MASYRYILADYSLGLPIAEVPFESASFSHVLNSPGVFSGTLGLQQPEPLQTILKNGIELGRVLMFVERDGVIVWGGFLWTSEADIDGGTLKLNGEGFLSYFRRRVFRWDYAFTSEDQLTIAQQFILDTLENSDGDPPAIFTTDDALSGVDRDRTVFAYERKSVGQELEQLAALDNGFDFRFDSFWDSNHENVDTLFWTMYPATGRQTNFVFEVGNQLSAMTIKSDATALATHVDAIGAGEGDAGLIATVANAGLIGVYPQLDDVVSHTDVTEFSTLEGHAHKRLRRGSAPVVIPDVVVDPSLDPTLGSYLTGDIVRARGGYGLAEVDGLFRITEIAVDVDDAGGEQAKLTFSGLEVF